MFGGVYFGELYFAGIPIYGETPAATGTATGWGDKITTRRIPARISNRVPDVPSRDPMADRIEADDEEVLSISALWLNRN